ncbi:HAD family hydrolase [Longispora albida]|uniref:HAD family hydrolase n=1 Tax=Longispora albida TaxID=203523 RepID=UPI00036D2997|nr:HAD family hydrolase [Longispora albida]
MSQPITTVLFDFAWTLFGQDAELWVREAAAVVGRPVAPGEPERIATEYADLCRATATDPYHRRRDLDPEVYRESIPALMAQVAGVDEVFAAALYATHLSALRPYPDAEPTLRALHDRGVRIGVVSNAGVDIRPACVEHGLDRYVDAYVISYEVGHVKPDLPIWEAALKALDADPASTLMIGDHPAGDAGSVAAGIAALILPPVPSLAERGLSRVLALV